MKTTKEMIAVMQAYNDGKPIQLRLGEGAEWLDTDAPKWSWIDYDYRVKPEKHLPTTWEDFCKTHPVKKGEAFINYYSIIRNYQSGESRGIDEDKNTLPNRRYAEAMLALCQLIQLRDCYNEGWYPNWEDRSNKYIIELYADKTLKRTGRSYWRFLAFKTEKLRDEFLKNFKDLIEIAKPLL